VVATRTRVIRGAPAVVRGVVGAELADGVPGPSALLATTVKVYGVPFSSPPTRHDVAVLLQLAPPGVAVTA
jgi:hypothetical protein